MADTSYQCTETDDFLLFHQKEFADYKTGMRLMSVSLERCEKAQIASLVCLMQKNELQDSVMVAFLKNPDEKKQGIKNLVKLLKKTKKTYRAMYFITNAPRGKECDYYQEFGVNCFSYCLPI